MADMLAKESKDAAPQVAPPACQSDAGSARGGSATPAVAASNNPLEEWLATRPECVRLLAAEFPIGLIFHHEGKGLWVLGYTEDDRLILTPVDPAVDYDGANRNKIYLCAEHLRG